MIDARREDEGIDLRVEEEGKRKKRIPKADNLFENKENQNLLARFDVGNVPITKVLQYIPPREANDNEITFSPTANPLASKWNAESAVEGCRRAMLKQLPILIQRASGTAGSLNRIAMKWGEKVGED